jgi:hypothetical protein
MRKAFWAVAVIGTLIAADAILANIPGPVPTAQAISNVEHSASFREIVGNGSYTYGGHTDNPSWRPQCIYGDGNSWWRYFDPVHEYTTTTLIFFLISQFEIVLVRVNPATGAIYGIQTQPMCF